MQYLINLSEESDHFLRQLCDPGRSPHSEAVSVEDFLSAFVEEQLDDLFGGDDIATESGESYGFDNLAAVNK